MYELILCIPKLSFYTFYFFHLCHILGIFFAWFFGSQIYTPPVSSLLLCPSFGGFCLTFDCHISLFKFPNRIFQNYLFSLHGNASPLPSDGVNMCISWYFPDCYMNSFLGVGCLSFMGFTFFIYLVILDCHLMSERVVYKLWAVTAPGQVTGHAMAQWPSGGSVGLGEEAEGMQF